MKIIKATYPTGNTYEIRQSERNGVIMELYKNGKCIGVGCINDICNSE